MFHKQAHFPGEQLEIKGRQDGKQKFLFASAGSLLHLALLEKYVILDLLRN